MAGLEALQQAILQRPGLVGYGVSAARDEGRERRLHELAQSGMLVEGILQALGLGVQQNRFNQQMGEQVRATGVQEDLAGRRLAMDEERQGWDRNVQGSPQYQEMQLQQLETALGLAKGQLGWFNQTRPMEMGRMQQDYELGGVQIDAARQGLQQSGEMFPLQKQGAQQSLDAGALNMKGEQQRQDAMKGQQEWLQRFRSAPSDAERFQIIGEDPDAWLQLQMGQMDMAGELAKAGTPEDYALEEIRKRQGTFQKIATTGVEGMIELTPSAASKARELEVAFMDLIQRIGRGDIKAQPGESREAFLGRILSMAGQVAPPQTGASQVPAQGNEDWTPARE